MATVGHPLLVATRNASVRLVCPSTIYAADYAASHTRYSLDIFILRPGKLENVYVRRRKRLRRGHCYGTLCTRRPVCLEVDNLKSESMVRRAGALVSVSLHVGPFHGRLMLACPPQLRPSLALLAATGQRNERVQLVQERVPLRTPRECRR